MYLSDIVRLAVKTLLEKRTRAILTIIGIAIGPLAMIMINGVTSGYSKYIVEQIQGLGQNLIVVTPTEDYELTESDLDFFKSLNGVADAVPFYTTQGRIRVGSEEKDVYVYAVDYDFLFKAIPSLEVRKGVIPSSSDIIKCIIGYDIAYEDNDRVYELGDVVSIEIINVKPGGKVEIKHLNLIVSAILEKYGGAAFLNPDQTIFMSLESAERLLGVKDWAGILILAEDPIYVNNITETINNVYGRNVNVISFLAIAEIASSITGAVNFMTFAASLAAFAVAVAGVAATMITSVIERTREIGVMKALGFTDGQVLILIISEGIIMSLIGAVIGISLGSIGAYILSSRGLTISSGFTEIVINAPPDINIYNISLTTLMTIFIGIIGSAFPAYRAAKIPPAMALRYE